MKYFFDRVQLFFCTHPFGRIIDRVTRMDYDIEFDYTSFLTEADADLNKLRDDLRSDLEKLNLVTLYQDKDSMAQAAKNINRLSARNWLVG